MLVLVISPPSRCVQGVLAVARGLLQSLSGGAGYVHLTTLDRFKTDWADRQSDNLVLFLDCPDFPLARVLANVAIPVVFLAEDPVESARHLVLTQGRTPEEAARAVAACHASIEPIVVSASRLLHLSPDQAGTPQSARARLADFLELASDRPDASAGALAPSAGAAPRAGEQIVLARWLVDALECFRAVTQLKPLISAYFPPEMFLLADPLGAPYLGGRIELLGAARILIYGPYLHLPVGLWRAHISIDVADNASGNLLKIEMMNGHDVIAQSLGPLPEEGSFTAIIDGRVAEAREPMQIRLSILQGAIEGALTLGSVKLTRLEDAEQNA